MHVFHFFTATLLIGVATASFWIRLDWKHDCDFRGYAPGGKVKTISKIEAPVAKIAQGGLASCIGDLANGAMIGSAGVNTVKEFTKKFAKLAPKLGATLGVFGVATSVLASLGEPGIDDVMESVNNAIDDLTGEMNNKLKQMEGYIDTKVINLEKNLIENNYKASYRLWRDCLNDFTAAEVEQCQMDAVKVLVSQRPYFAPSDLDVLAMKKLSGFERRRVETSLILFRDYANLVIMELTPLINKFCEDKSTRGKHHCKRFSDDMNTEVNFFIKYSQNAIKLIEAANGKYGECTKTLQCGKQHVVKEGAWIPVHTANWFECKCVIEDANTKQFCKVRGTIRKDGKRPSGYIQYNYNVRTDEQAAKEFGGRITAGEAEKYQNHNRPIVKKYWEKNVLLMLPVWRKALENAQYGMRLSDEEENDEVEEEMNDLGSWNDLGSSLAWYKYSKGFEARMKKAGLKL